MSKGSGKASRLAWCTNAPLRILCKTRDLYAKSAARCAGRRAPVRNSVFPWGSRGEAPTEVAADAAASVAPTVAAASPAAERLHPPLDPRRRRLLVAQEGRAITRSRSAAAVGRIDEDEPSDFFDREKVESDLLLLRSKSLAVELRRRGRKQIIH